MKSSVVLGYSPYAAPRTNPIYPFDSIFDYGANVALLKNLNTMDAIVLWGGADIPPSFYDSHPIAGSGPYEPTTRDLFEWELLRQAIKQQIPIIGVCRGAQMVCAFAGGKLVQDVAYHGQSHQVETFDGARMLASSSHHQMMYPYDVDHKLLAWSEKSLSTHYSGISQDRADKLLNKDVKEPEVVYFPEINAIACQPHPEWHQAGNPFNVWLNDQIVNFCFDKVEC